MALEDVIELYSGSTRDIQTDSSFEANAQVIEWTHSPTTPSGGGRAFVVRKSTDEIAWESVINGVVSSWIKDENGAGLLARLSPVSITGVCYFIVRSDSLNIKGTSSYRWAIVRGIPKRELDSTDEILTVFDTIPTMSVSGYVNLALEVWNDYFSMVNIRVHQTRVRRPDDASYNNIICEFQDTSSNRLIRGGAWGIMGVSNSSVDPSTTRHGYTFWGLSS